MMVLGIAIGAIFAALFLYTLGVWAERIQGRLKVWHLGVFWLGFVFDTLGTGAMFRLAGGMEESIHAITGVLAIVLMLVHATWASVVLARKDEKMILRFHKFSIIVWIVWLVPMLSRMIFRT